MAVCHTPRDDLRIVFGIRSCLKQMLYVIGTVNKRNAPGAEVSFLIQYLIAGIYAQSEVHRALVPKTMLQNQTKFWILRRSDFVPVLDHLWRGVSSGGRPVRWNDYMRSLEAMPSVIT
ncbi:putative fungal zn(2)-cys(6) binuclear cluster domain protein [Rhizoctonia solani 123E]|uniref:Putative fungal zn(2)-cys(6) binuclear cluster domain protein n=1 Tax=Rhizoctonia solani 123E TaxID=1423351 RepID=A0A074RLK8_9AGAM|nr:putative fungal zn(2)-cys(6) binuclear cluster domain protein [Rhizoctonia solani 123E]